MEKPDTQTRSNIAGEVKRALEAHGLNVRVSTLETALDAAVSGYV